MAKKKSAAAKKGIAGTSSSSTGATGPVTAGTVATASTAKTTSTTPAPASHTTLQTSLLRCAALCVASKSALRSQEIPISNTPLDELPTHEQILSDARALFKRLSSTANALALAVKVSGAQSKVDSAKGTSSAGQAGVDNPLAGLDSGSIAAAQAQLDLLTTDILPKLVYVSRKVTKEGFVQHDSHTDDQGPHNSCAHMGGLGQAFDKAINRAVRETVDSVDSFIECFMDLKTRSALLASEQARYKAAVQRGDEMSTPPRPPAYPRIENLSPSALRKRALIRYDSLFKLCERLADPTPPAESPIVASDYKHLFKSDEDEGEDAGDRINEFEVTLAQNYMQAHIRGLPRDNWEALQRFHDTRTHQLGDAVREIREALIWSEQKETEDAAAEGGAPKQTAVVKKDEPAAEDEEEDDDDDEDEDDEDDDDDFEDDFDDLDDMDEYAAADIDRAKRALPVVENVIRAHNLLGTIFRDPAARLSFAEVPRYLFDNLSEQADDLVADVDNMIGVCIYAGDAVVDARHAAEQLGLKEGKKENGDGDGDDDKGKKGEEEGKTGGPYDAAIAEELEEDAEMVFAEHLVAFAQNGMAIATHGIEVAVREEELTALAKVAEQIEATCKEAVGEERWLSLQD
ncbi:unnamed protein product [Tilletia laevis]|uniref:Uncharacterized protein n=2 Tax=Tilletia TaxID=13289 RepID=A0A177VBS2_9BASI|nr:hypothetical protein CF336_g472 [Tilletia laevis]KAE8265407.1 hypothetical protein A4X03_0g281 [Tilletia caries]KAE8208798.1 hypothetical protein CF335_g150 [Tilletia laevis]CAD6888801.1 unnamed protein product [Tilletia caries]CAD6916430.1 unnamed protein product [Tilletia laevis]